MTEDSTNINSSNSSINSSSNNNNNNNLTVKVTSVAKLDWPSSKDDLPKAKVQCGTLSYQLYHARKTDKIPMDYYSKFKKVDESKNENKDDESKNEEGGGGGGSAMKLHFLDLRKASASKLEKLSYYQILGNIHMHATPEQIKRAFHKACLKYHPDKEDAAAAKKNAASKDAGGQNGDEEKKKGKGEDPVFLKVKEAFETLSDPKMKKSYDSTVDFDDKIPSAAEIKSDQDFYKIFGDCFQKNLRFAAENEPGLANNAKDKKKDDTKGGGKKKNKKKNNKKNGKVEEKKEPPPKLGDDNTAIEDVHRFYDYWVRFESWRDFTLVAKKETEHDTDTAECRYEKRWMEKEIARKAKHMKKDEIARITKLVDRSMALDPRLIREKKRVEQEKLDKEREKKERAEREAREAKEKAEREEKERVEREAFEKEERARLKVQKEQGKKILRKAKASLRKAVLAQYEVESGSENKTWASFDDMNDDIEFLCGWLDASDLRDLADHVLDPEVENKLGVVKERAVQFKASAQNQSDADIKKRDALRQAAAEKEAAQKAARASKPWSQEELAALAKAVKKYPTGGGNRWDTIAQFINTLCQLPDPRTKEECIEKYNSIAKSDPTSKTNTTSGSNVNGNGQAEDPSGWSRKQDEQLQAGLSKYPSSMDKNKRWTSIANGVEGKNKKECVERFKAIREALKKK